MKLYNPYPTQIEHCGKIYELNISAKNVFLACDALEDDVMSDSYKTSVALDLLVKTKHSVNTGLLSAIFDFIFPRKEKSEPLIDLEMDAALIVAAFRQAYGIQLKNEIGEINIFEFMDLLQGVPKNTRLAERIELRQTPIPKPNKYNAEYRAKLIEAKQKVAIKKKNNKSMGLYALYSGMTAMIKAGD